MNEETRQLLAAWALVMRHYNGDTAAVAAASLVRKIDGGRAGW